MRLLTDAKTGKEKQLVQSPHRVLATRVYAAVTWQEQLIGLIGQELGQEEALYLRGCRQIHTAFLKYPIDVAFFDDRHACHPCMVHVETVAPWRISRYVPESSFVIEMHANSPLSTLKAGCRVDLL